MLRDCPRFDDVQRLLRCLHFGISRVMLRGFLEASALSENVLVWVEIRCCLEGKVLGTSPVAILGTISLKRFLDLPRSLPKMNRRGPRGFREVSLVSLLKVCLRFNGTIGLIRNCWERVLRIVKAIFGTISLRLLGDLLEAYEDNVV